MRHRTRLVVLVSLAAGLLFAAAPARAAKVKEQEPGPKAAGTLCAWTSRDGLVYWYRVPKAYDPAKGANLTFILHGSNLDHEWGFANHSKDDFRPDDIVVSPDGTTANGDGGFNFLGVRKDAQRLKALHDELKALLTVRRTYLYGHSQGSFFAFYYAGEHPEAVDGVVGHASGVWTLTAQGRKGHHQAIVLMHGTQDPVVPYGQSVGGLQSFREKGYPLVRLRSLEGWNHWPAEHNGPVPHTSQQLAWCEGMTTDDPERLAACFDLLAKPTSKERHDYAALYSLGARIAGLEGAQAAPRKRAEAAVAGVRALAAAHVEALEVPEKGAFDGEPWIGHLPMFLRAFDGVPECETLRAAVLGLLERQEKDGGKHLRKYWPALQKGDAGDAFKAGAAALERGFLWFPTWDARFRENLAAWRKDAKALGLRRGDTKAYDAMSKDFEKALVAGAKAFDKVNRGADAW